MYNRIPHVFLVIGVGETLVLRGAYCRVILPSLLGPEGSESPWRLSRADLASTCLEQLIHIPFLLMYAAFACVSIFGPVHLSPLCLACDWNIHESPTLNFSFFPAFQYSVFTGVQVSHLVKSRGGHGSKQSVSNSQHFYKRKKNKTRHSIGLMNLVLKLKILTYTYIL